MLLLLLLLLLLLEYNNIISSKNNSSKISHRNDYGDFIYSMAIQVEVVVVVLVVVTSKRMMMAGMKVLVMVAGVEVTAVPRAAIVVQRSTKENLNIN